MTDPAITYRPRPDATPEAELNALANVYAYVLRCHDSKKLTEHPVPDDPEDKEDLENARTAKPTTPR